MMYIITFNTTQAAIKAEDVLLKNAVICDVFPVPKDISAECGISLRVDVERLDVIGTILKDNNIEYELHKRKDK